MKRLLLLFASLTITVICCCQQIDTSHKVATLKLDKTVYKDIQKGQAGQPVLAFAEIQRVAQIYKMDDLTKGYDSIEIRIWFEYSLEKTHLIVIKRTAYQSSCQLFTFKDSANIRLYGAVMLPHTIQNMHPRSGWSDFFHKMVSFNITTLPGSGVGLNGVLYYVEVATKNKYRFYEYWSPEAYVKKANDVQNMENILLLLENEFGFKRLKE